MSKPSDRYKYLEPKEAEKLLDAIEEQLKTRFQEIRHKVYNPNTKGYDYEEILKQFLEDYLGGAFDFLIRVGILDAELKANSIFKPKENEFDLIATYKNAIPKLVYHRLVPYDSVAFIIEVKQTLKLPELKKDLLKFDKLNKLQVADNRTGIYASSGVFTSFKVKRPLRFLFYYEAEAKVEKIFQILEGEYGKSWDVCVVLKDEVVFLNSTLPYVQERWKGAHFVRDFDYPLLKGMFFTCIFIEGNFVDSWLIFWNLFRSLIHSAKKL